MKTFIIIPFLYSLYLVFPPLGSGEQDPVIAGYLEQNKEEQRLAEYSDSDEMLRLKLKQLEVINASRRKYKAPPVTLDILACRVANKMAVEAAREGYVGHWNLAGEKPYQRYAAAGGTDHVTENASGVSTTGRFSYSFESILSLCTESHQAFMAEKKPADGHKQTVINSLHNRVGIGIGMTEKEFRYYELFIDSYYSFSGIPSELKPGEEIRFICNPGTGRYINLVMAYFEPPPSPLSPREISSRPYYNDFTGEVADEIPPWDCEKLRKSNGDYTISLKTSKRGDYYIQIYSSDAPYREGERFNTEGKLQASGLVIRVR